MLEIVLAGSSALPAHLKTHRFFLVKQDPRGLIPTIHSVCELVEGLGRENFVPQLSILFS